MMIILYDLVVIFKVTLFFNRIMAFCVCTILHQVGYKGKFLQMLQQVLIHLLFNADLTVIQVRCRHLKIFCDRSCICLIN